MAKGKYASVIDGLPRMLGAPGAEPTYQERVEARKRELLDGGLPRQAAALAREYALLREERERLEAEASALNLRLEAVSQLMADQFEAEGTAALTLDGGRRVSVYLEPYAQVTDREAFRRWCMEDPDLVRAMALPWQTTNAMTKAMLLRGDPEPPGVTCFAKTKIRLGGE